jgi:uncharacterized membrane protein
MVHIDAVSFEYGWQAAFVVWALLLGVRFVRLSTSSAAWRRRRRRVWPAAALLGAALLLLVRWVSHAWPSTWPALFIALAAGAVLLLNVLTYRHASRPVAPRTRRLLLLLRTMALAAAALALLRPEFVRRTETRAKPSVFFLYDTSRSMAIQDGRRGMSRIEDLHKVSADTASRMARLTRRFDVQQAAVSADLTPLPAPDGRPLDLRAAGPATAIGPALRDLLDRHPPETGGLAAIVLASDGSHNTGLEPDRVAALLRERETPVYALGFGRDVASGQVRDVAVRTIVANPTVFTRNLFPVTGELALLGLAGRTVAIELLFDDQVVDRKEITPVGENESPRVTLSFAPETVGIHKVTLRAHPAPDEIVKDNNEAGVYVNVLAGGLGVLYVEGQARWEFKFLRRTLEASPDFQVAPALVLAPLAPGPRTNLPPDLFNWDRYEVVILGDVKPEVFTRAELDGLKDAVSERGKGLMMIGGQAAFGPGGWDATPLADALPVRMDRADAPAKGFYQMVPSPSAARHFVLQIEEDAAASRAAWERLPPLDGASGLPRPKPAAEVLATGKDNGPLLVAHQYGKGRALAFGADTTWRWAFSEAETAKYHKRFWRQVVLWLAQRDKAQGDQVWITLNKQRYRRGEKAEITAHVQDAAGRPIPDADLRATLLGPDGATDALSFNFDADAYQAVHEPARRGDYAVKVVAFRAGKEIGQAEARLVVYVPDVELEHPIANLALLRALAAETRGAYFDPDHAADLFDALLAKDVPHTVLVRVETFPLWDNVWLFLVFCAALVGEWVLRKRKGMM